MPVGTNITASSFNNFVSNKKDDLGQNIWTKTLLNQTSPITQSYENIMKGYDNQLHSLNKNYEEVVNQAYDSYVTNKRFSLDSNYGTGDLARINEAYTKAYEQSREQYKSQYMSGLTDIVKNMSETENDYYDTIGKITANVAGQQQTLATNYAGFFNSYYDYIEYLYENYSNDENIFGNTSYLSQFVNENTLKSREDVLKMMSTEENGQRVLTEEALNYMNAINSFKMYAGDAYTGMNSFDAWLYENNPELAEFMFGNNSQTVNAFYNDLGLENAYDTKFLSDWKPENSYTNVDVDGDTFDYKLKNESTGGKDFKIIIGGNTVMLKAGNVVSDTLQKALNKQLTGDTSKTPTDSSVQMYDDEMYLYTEKHGWRAINSNRDDVQVLKDIWKNKVTKQSSAIKANVKPADMTLNMFNKTDYKHWSIDDGVHVDDNWYNVNRVPNDVKKYLDSMYGHIYRRKSLNFDFNVDEIYEYNGKYYVFMNDSGETFTPYELRNYKPSK